MPAPLLPLLTSTPALKAAMAAYGTSIIGAPLGAMAYSLINRGTIKKNSLATELPEDPEMVLSNLYSSKARAERKINTLRNRESVPEFKIQAPSEYEKLNALASFKDSLRKEAKLKEIADTGANLKFGKYDPEQYKYIDSVYPEVNLMKLLESKRRGLDLSPEFQDRMVDLIADQWVNR